MRQSTTLCQRVFAAYSLTFLVSCHAFRNTTPIKFLFFLFYARPILQGYITTTAAIVKSHRGSQTSKFLIVVTHSSLSAFCRAPQPTPQT